MHLFYAWLLILHSIYLDILKFALKRSSMEWLCIHPTSKFALLPAPAAVANKPTMDNVKNILIFLVQKETKSLIYYWAFERSTYRSSKKCYLRPILAFIGDVGLVGVAWGGNCCVLCSCALWRRIRSEWVRSKVVPVHRTADYPSLLWYYS